MTLSASLLASLAIGLIIGLERGWKERGDPTGSRVAGFRTFGLIGLVGGLAATLDTGNGLIISAGAIGLALLLRQGFEAHIEESRNVSATTMIAALITFSLGAVAVKLSPLLAGGGAVVTAFILWLREPMHRLLDRIDAHEMSAFLRLLLISVVILPAMPDVGLGPYRVINPRHIWWMVVLISGLGFVGYVGVKALGERAGVGLLAFAGGLASSTAATLSLSQLSKAGGRPSAYAGGVAMAWSVMVMRTALIVAAIRPALLPMLWQPLGAMLAATVVIAGFMLWRQPARTEAKLALPNPLDLKSALVFAAVLTGALVLSRLAQAVWGDSGVFGVATLAGAVDADAVTLSMGHLSAGELSDQVAARAIMIAVMVNTVFKVVLALGAGTRRFSTLVLLIGALTISSGLLAMIAAISLGSI
ncbi:MgtC/SapB family protein [Hyphomonas sp.]|uniref:MgtC/SapB family protein n=1 Tax=Hyphomonas sp. TaxID=87 RepID=UPI0035281539